MIAALFVSPVRAQADCLALLGFGARDFTAAAVVKLSDADFRANIPKAAEHLFDKLADQGADFVKLENLLRENWLVGESLLTEDSIRPSFSGPTPFIKMTRDFFTQLEEVLSQKPELALEVREAVIKGLRARFEKEETAREEVRAAAQKKRFIDLRFEQTSTGAIFEPNDHPTMGRSVQDPSGMIWSERLPDKFKNEGPFQNGIVTDSEAVRACSKIGGRLPTREDYEKLRGYFELNEKDHMTRQGASDFHRIFPDMVANTQFWSSSVSPDNSNHANVFFGFSGTVLHYSDRNDVKDVLCVSGP